MEIPAQEERAPLSDNLKFMKYPSIENSYQQREIDKFLYEGMIGGEWVGHEKVHGSNLSFVTDGTEVRFSSRNQILGKDDNFFGYHSLRDRMKEFILAIKTEYHQAKEGRVFGELFGGMYEHPDVPRQCVSRVQKGVHYSPGLEFRVFDIVIDGQFMDVDDAESIVEHVGIFKFVPRVFTGTFDEALKVENKFQTLIPKELGLPEIENNWCEGVVLRPNETRFLMDGSRVILKSKNDAFKEVSTAPKKVRLQEEVTGEVQEQLDSISVFVTDNRLDNVASKIGDVTIRDFGRVHKELLSDVFAEAGKVVDLKALDPKVGKFVGSICAAAVKAYLMKRS